MLYTIRVSLVNSSCFISIIISYRLITTCNLLFSPPAKLLIQKALNTLFGCFFKLFVVYRNLRNLAVCRESFVNLFPVFLHDGSDGLIRVLVVGIDSLEVRIDESGEFTFFLDHDRFAHVRKVIQMIFNFFRVDILTTGAENHVFTTPLDEKVTFFVNQSKVSRAEPAVGCESGMCGRLVLVVPDHEIVSFG